MWYIYIMTNEKAIFHQNEKAFQSNPILKNNNNNKEKVSQPYIYMKIGSWLIPTMGHITLLFE